MPSGENWTKEETQKELSKRAHRILADVKEYRSMRYYVKEKVCDRPLTIIEREVTHYCRKCGNKVLIKDDEEVGVCMMPMTVRKSGICGGKYIEL